jgi:hypothetical protein
MNALKGGERTLTCHHNLNNVSTGFFPANSGVKQTKVVFQNTPTLNNYAVLNHIGWKTVKCK